MLPKESRAQISNTRDGPQALQSRETKNSFLLLCCGKGCQSLAHSIKEVFERRSLASKALKPG